MKQPTLVGTEGIDERNQNPPGTPQTPQKVHPPDPHIRVPGGTAAGATTPAPTIGTCHDIVVTRWWPR